MLIASGVLIRKIGLFGMEIDLGLLAIPVTVLWLTGAINALNLLDGMDGMATVIGLILSLAICALAVLTGHAAVAVAALVFAGALLGFLPFNLSPAKIYLGDAGSMLIGIVVGCLSIRATVKGAGTVLLAAPLAVMTIPILDSFAAILRRRLAGQSIYAADRGHLHHRLLAHFGNKYTVLVCVAICSAITCGFALVSTATKNDIVALVASLAVVATLAVTGWFGRGEFVLLFVAALACHPVARVSVRCRQRHGPREHGTHPRFAKMGDPVGNPHGVGRQAGLDDDPSARQRPGDPGGL